MVPARPLAATTHAQRGGGLQWVLLQMLFFLLPASFAYPSLALKLMPATLCAALLWLVSQVSGTAAPLRYFGFLAALAPLLLSATVSVLANGDREEVFVSYAAGYLSMVIVFVAVRSMGPTYRQIQTALLTLSWGALIPLGLGLLSFYQEFGLPDVGTLLNARYAFERIAPYGAVTFGNVNNTAAFLAILTPVFFCQAIERESSGRRRAWFALCTLLCVANLLIVNSRAAFFTVAVVLAATVWYYKRRVTKSLLLAGALSIVLLLNFLNGADGLFWENMRRASAWDVQEDQSVGERIESIHEGLDVLSEHFICGVGPGCSHYYISLHAAHQMSIQHGVELGIVGLLSITLLTWLVVKRTFAALLVASPNPAERQAFICLSGPLAYLLMGAMANVPVNIGAVSAWGMMVAALLAVVDCRTGSSRQTVRATLLTSTMNGMRRTSSITSG